MQAREQRKFLSYQSNTAHISTLIILILCIYVIIITINNAIKSPFSIISNIQRKYNDRKKSFINEFLNIPHGPAIWVQLHFCALKVPTTVVGGERVIPNFKDLGGAFSYFLEF